MEDREVKVNHSIEPPSGSTSPLRWLWPEVDSSEGAIKAIRLGILAALFLVVVSAGFTTIGFLEGRLKDPSAYLDPALFGVIAFGLSRRSRAAALAGILLYVAEIAFSWATHGFTGTNVLLVSLLVIGFLNGVRGAFAYRRYNPVLTPSTSQILGMTKSVLTYIAVALAALILPPVILSALVLVSARVGINAPDSFFYLVILASLLPGTIVILKLRVRPILKATASILYLLVGVPSLIVYLFIFLCVALGECL